MKNGMGLLLMICISTVFAGGLISPMADASSDYEKLVVARKDRMLYVNTRSLASPSEGVVSLWDKVVPRQGSLYHRKVQREIRHSGGSFRDLAYFQTLTEIDCERDIHRNVSTLYYDGNDRILLAMDAPDFRWHEILPGQKETLLRDEVCGNYASIPSFQQVAAVTPVTSMGCPDIP